jgi:hypothetical protein
MKADDLLAALAIPADARVDQRVPKKTLAEMSKTTASDRRQILDGIEEIHWIAALKPSNVGVPEFRDDVREYLEIAVLSVMLRPNARASRLIELIHRAIPYPVALIATQESTLGFSLGHKRQAQNEAALAIVDGDIVAVAELGNHPADGQREVDRAFLTSLELAQQPRSNLMTVYQGWIDRAEALLAARLTGRFAPPESAETAEMRRKALKEHDRIAREMVSLRAQAERETQINHRVELNLAIKRLQKELVNVRGRL